MKSDVKKRKIKKLVKDMMIESQKKALANIDKILNSDSIDIDNWDENINSMVLPKTILTAILEEEARQYSAKGTSFEKQVRKEIENIKYFL